MGYEVSKIVLHGRIVSKSDAFRTQSTEARTSAGHIASKKEAFRRLPARAAEAARAALGVREGFRLLKLDREIGQNDELGYPVAVGDGAR